MIRIRMHEIRLGVEGLKDLPGGKPPAGLGDDEREAAAAGKILHDLADAPGPGQPAPQAEGHVRPQLKPQGLQLPIGEAGPPQLIQPPEHRRGISAAAAHAGPHRNALENGDFRPLRISGMLLQQGGGPVGQMPLIGLQPGIAPRRQNQAGGGQQGHGIRQGDGLHEHVHQVISVLPETGDIQGPVDFRAGFQLHGRSSLPGQFYPTGQKDARHSCQVGELAVNWGGIKKRRNGKPYGRKQA